MSETKMKPERVWVTRSGLEAAVIQLSGSRCGYVALPPGHPLHGVGYDVETYVLGGRSPDEVFDVHGGITFSGARDWDDKFWYGYDCMHYGDQTVFFPGTVRTLEFCIEECEKLADQLKAVRDTRSWWQRFVAYMRRWL